MKDREQKRNRITSDAKAGEKGKKWKDELLESIIEEEKNKKQN